MKDIKEIGKIFEKARKEKGLSIDDVSKKTHIHTKIITCLENGTIEAELNKNKVYIKSFIKKYAAFIGIDGDKIISEYSLFNIVPEEDEQELYIKPKKDPVINIKQLMPILGLLVSLAVVVFIFMGLIKVKNFISQISTKKVHVKESRKIQPVKKEIKKTASKKKEIEVEKVGFKKDIVEKKEALKEKPKQMATPPKIDGVNLTLKCSDNVWLKIDKDGSSIFKGVLNKNSVESWKADKEIRIRVGKLEALDFTVNNKHIGKVGNGFQDVVINKNEIKAGDKKFPL